MHTMATLKSRHGIHGANSDRKKGNKTLADSLVGSVQCRFRQLPIRPSGKNVT